MGNRQKRLGARRLVRGMAARKWAVISHISQAQIRGRQARSARQRSLRNRQRDLAGHRANREQLGGDLSRKPWLSEFPSHSKCFISSAHRYLTTLDKASRSRSFIVMSSHYQGISSLSSSSSLASLIGAVFASPATTAGTSGMRTRMASTRSPLNSTSVG